MNSDHDLGRLSLRLRRPMWGYALVRALPGILRPEAEPGAQPKPFYLGFRRGIAPPHIRRRSRNGEAKTDFLAMAALQKNDRTGPRVRSRTGEAKTDFLAMAALQKKSRTGPQVRSRNGEAKTAFLAMAALQKKSLTGRRLEDGTGTPRQPFWLWQLCRKSHVLGRRLEAGTGKPRQSFWLWQLCRKNHVLGRRLEIQIAVVNLMRHVSTVVSRSGFAARCEAGLGPAG